MNKEGGVNIKLKKGGMNIKLKKEGGVNVKLKKEGGFFIAVIRYNMHFDHNVIFNKFYC